MNEIWEDIESYEGLYQVSSWGRVRSVKRNIIRKLHPDTQGYLGLVLSKNGKQRPKNVHRLVADAFLRKRVKGEVVDHIDNNRLNNNLSNLQVITHEQNLRKSPFGTSKYRGVTRCNTHNRWLSRLHINNKRIFIGYFRCETKAHIAYQKALIKHGKEGKDYFEEKDL